MAATTSSTLAVPRRVVSRNVIATRLVSAAASSSPVSTSLARATAAKTSERRGMVLSWRMSSARFGSSGNGNRPIQPATTG
jgi:hypothetical protein